MGDFGVAVSPFELDEWVAATGITPDLVMIFEAWSRQRALTDVLNKARYHGHTQIAVTWEPWQPVPVGTAPDQQGQPQPEFAPERILAGDHDDYIDAVARSIRDSGLLTWIRLGHEMNGGWYPWSADPAGYIAAWRYIRHRMRSVRAAWNTRFVWAPNPDLWRASPADWLVRLMPFWPGPAAVDAIGATVIEFGREDRSYSVDQFAARFALCRQIFLRPVRAMEVNVARERAVPWLLDLAAFAGRPDRPLPMVILSQGASRASAVGGTGDLDWSVADDPDAREALRALIRALHGDRF